MLRSRGLFAIKFVKEGAICINNYNYYLRTQSGNQIDKDFMIELGDTIDGLANQIYVKMNHNLFTAKSDLCKSIQEVIGVYKSRIM